MFPSYITTTGAWSDFTQPSLNSGVSNSFVQKFRIELVEPVGTCNAGVFYGPLSLSSLKKLHLETKSLSEDNL